jgi:hypothetical protein
MTRSESYLALAILMGTVCHRAAPWLLARLGDRRGVGHLVFALLAVAIYKFGPDE